MLSLARAHHFYEVALFVLPAQLTFSLRYAIKVFLTQALGMGLGQALLFLPSLSILGQHFRRRRALAIGIATSVNSISAASNICLRILMFVSLGCIGWWNCLANYAESIESVHIVCERDSSNSWRHLSASYYFELDCKDEATAVQIVLEPKHLLNTKGRPLCDIHCVVRLPSLTREFHWLVIQSILHKPWSLLPWYVISLSTGAADSKLACF